MNYIRKEMAGKRLKDGICHLAVFLKAHAVSVMAQVRNDFYVIGCIMEHIFYRRLLMHSL